MINEKIPKTGDLARDCQVVMYAHQSLLNNLFILRSYGVIDQAIVKEIGDIIAVSKQNWVHEK